MASLRHILMLLLLLFTQLQEIGTGSESRCDCVISLIYNGTLSEVSWTLSKQLCNAENEGYIIKTPRSQNSSEPEYILFCTCKSGRPSCRVEPTYNYSIAKNIITLTLNTSDEGTFSFEKLPSSEKCQCTFRFSPQVPYLPEEDATTSTTRNPHPATTLTTSSTTPTQDASSASNNKSDFLAATVVLAILFVAWVVASFIIIMLLIRCNRRLQKQPKETVEESKLKAQQQKPKKDASTNTEVQPSIPVPASDDTSGELEEQSAKRKPHMERGNTKYKVPVPAAGAGASHVLHSATSSEPSAYCVQKEYAAYCVHETSTYSTMPVLSVDNATDQEENITDDSQPEENMLPTDAVKTRPEEQQAKGRYLTISYSGETDA